jgi:energy-coupling factor transporter ATP-binding protein EcfA2
METPTPPFPEGDWGPETFASQPMLEFRLRTFRRNASAHHQLTMNPPSKLDRLYRTDLQDITQRVVGAALDDSKVVVLIRGTPGIGKSTLAECLLGALEALAPTEGEVINVAADDFMTQPSGDRGLLEYLYDPDRISECHVRTQEVVLAFLSPATCQRSRKFMQDGNFSSRFLLVNNTFSTPGEVQPYFHMAQERSQTGVHVKVVVVDLNSLLWARGPSGDVIALDRENGSNNIAWRLARLPNTHRVPELDVQKMLARYCWQWWYLEVWSTRFGSTGLLCESRWVARSANRAWCNRWPELFQQHVY